MAKKIAVLRANALGDFIFVLPALTALREAFPDAEIVYLGREWHKTYLENRPGPVDRVEIVPPYRGISASEDDINNEDEIEPFFVRMRGEEFDIALQLHGGGFNSNPFVKRLGAKVTIGLKTPNATPLDVNIAYVTAYSEIMRFIEVVGYLGARPSNYSPAIAVTENDLNEAYNILSHPKDSHFAVIHGGASDQRRRWPPANFAKIADHLAVQGYRVYLTGTDFEQAVVEEILASVVQKDKVHNLCNKLSLGGMTGLLSLADIMVSNDTGPLHLARALETPTVGIFWTVNSLTAQWPNTHLHRSLIAWDPYCPLCGTDCLQAKIPTDQCTHDTSFTIHVKVEDVKEALDDVFSFISERTIV